VKKLGNSGQKAAFSWWKNGQDENDILRRNRKKSKALLISHTNRSAHEEPISLKTKNSVGV
jgi:hypothetical protein